MCRQGNRPLSLFRPFCPLIRSARRPPFRIAHSAAQRPSKAQTQAFEGGKFSRKRPTRILRAFRATLWEVVFTARIIPNLPPHHKRRQTNLLYSSFAAAGAFDAAPRPEISTTPRGRPPSLPFDLDEQVLCDLESRMDKTTLLVTPSLSQIANKLKVSRASIKRVVASLRSSGYIELCYTKKRPTDKVCTILYKLLRHDSRQTASTCGS